ncbi:MULTISPECIES: hypothetical protein [Pseudomonas]|uniref:hypothetical protein n=1 Tax=Pseudomonas TaxID=286 RepID=UPI00123AC74C|nr:MULTISPECIES: hypothetical protein [Pseudomonas]QIB52917.1 hypothetical protein G3M63_18805 [Pseudomonas sp. OIL-1]
MVRTRARSGHRQRGALIFITPLLLTAIALMSALIIDAARLYALKAEMQSQVNAAATAASDASQACGGPGVTMQDMSQRALSAARAQGFDGDQADLNVQAGLLDASPDEPDQLVFQRASSFDQSNATLVSYRRDEPLSQLFPKLLGNVMLQTNAAVRKEMIATLSASGSAAGVGEGLLGSVLGALLNEPAYRLDPLDIDSLGNTLFRVGDILGELGVDSLEAALPLGADQLATALRSIAGAASPAGELADDLLGVAGIDSVLVGDLIRTVEGAEAPDDATIRSYDLLVNLALNIARQQQLSSGSPLEIRGLETLGLPLLPAIAQDSLVLRLFVNRAPSIAVGPARRGTDGMWLTRFDAPGISLEVEASLGLLSSVDLLGVVKFSLADLNIPLAIELGGGSGELVSAKCARGTQNETTLGVRVVTKGVSLGSGSIEPATGELLASPIQADIGRLTLLGGLFGSLLTIDPAVGLSLTIDGRLNGVETTINSDPYSLFCESSGCTRLRLGHAGGIGGLDLNVYDAQLVLLGEITIAGLLDALLSLVLNLLNDAISSLLEALVSPLAKALGVGVGGMQVSIEAAKQDSSQLIENVAVYSSAQ